MSTTVTAIQRRSFEYGMFADLTDSAHTRPQRAGNAVTITFEADLSPETVAAIVARLESTDDVDQAKRAELAALIPEASAITAALIRYVLGHPDAPTEAPEEPPAT